MSNALSDEAICYALHATHQLTAPDDVADRSGYERLAEALDQDIAAAQRLYRLACVALIKQDKSASDRPDSMAKPPALKPHHVDLAYGIQRLWRDLGRSDKGRDGAARAEFAARIFEYIWQVEEVQLERVDDLFKRATKTFGKV